MTKERPTIPNTSPELANPLKDISELPPIELTQVFNSASHFVSLEASKHPKPNQAKFTVNFIPGTELSRIAGLAKANQVDVSTSDQLRVQELRKMVKNFDHLVQVTIARLEHPDKVVLNEQILPKTAIHLSESISLNPQIFVDRSQTAQFNQTLDLIHNRLVVSGVWVMFAEFFGEDIFDTRFFNQRITGMDPKQAIEILQTMADQVDDLERTKIVNDKFHPPLPKTVKVNSAQANSVPKPKIASIFGIPDNVLPSSVLGVATALGHREGDPIVLTLAEKSQLDEHSVFNYGTTDFANPVEAIMLSVAASFKNPDGTVSTRVSFYDTDPDSHSVKSYLERVLIPSLVSTGLIPPEQLPDIKAKLQNLDSNSDIDLDELDRMFDSADFSDYLIKLKTLSKSNPSTFAQLYDALNKQLCQRLGIFHTPSSELFAATQAKLSDITDFGALVTEASKNHYDQFHQRLAETDFDDSAKSGFARGVFGNGPWDIATRKLIRSIEESEPDINHFDLEGDILLADLKEQGLTLGGNGWALLLQQLEHHFDTPIVVAHKNTSLGSNYVAPLSVGTNTKALVSPVVRVVPGGSVASTGDGLDIGFYLAHPELISIVKNAFELRDADFQGGKQKAVVEVEPYVYYFQGQSHSAYRVTTSLEASSGGGSKRQLITSQIITK